MRGLIGFTQDLIPAMKNIFLIKLLTRSPLQIRLHLNARKVFGSNPIPTAGKIAQTFIKAQIKNLQP